MKSFWYETNTCWGLIESIEDLKEKYDIHLQDKSSNIKNVNDFLKATSTKKSKPHNNFGMRREHFNSDYTLKMHLQENSLLAEFLKLTIPSNMDFINYKSK